MAVAETMKSQRELFM